MRLSATRAALLLFSGLALAACRPQAKPGAETGTASGRQTVAGRDPTTNAPAALPPDGEPTPAEPTLVVPTPPPQRAFYDSAPGTEQNARLLSIDRAREVVTIKLTTGTGLEEQPQAGHEYDLPYGQLPALTGLPADESIARIEAQPLLRVKVAPDQGGGGTHVTAILLPWPGPPK